MRARACRRPQGHVTHACRLLLLRLARGQRSSGAREGGHATRVRAHASTGAAHLLAMQVILPASLATRRQAPWLAHFFPPQLAPAAKSRF
jgi:hypothetical protein